jgi:hypothetical protein
MVFDSHIAYSRQKDGSESVDFKLWWLHNTLLSFCWYVSSWKVMTFKPQWWINQLYEEFVLSNIK